MTLFSCCAHQNDVTVSKVLGQCVQKASVSAFKRSMKAANVPVF